MFGGEQGLAHLGGGVGRPEPFQERGLLAHATESGEDMQMKPVILAADQKKKMGGVSVGGSEMNRMNGAGEHDKRF